MGVGFIMEKMLNKINVLDKPTEVASEMRLSLNPSVESGYDVLSVQGLSKKFGSNILFENLNDFNKITYDASTTLEFGHLFKYLAKIYNLVIDGPGKFMGLQSYGNKINSSFYEELQSAGINNYEQLKEILDNHLSGIDIYNKNYNQNDMDKIYTSHKFLEDEIVNVFNRFDKSKEIGYSGGCALNTVTNTRLLNEGYKLSICPAANDAGLSIGGVVALNYFLLGRTFEIFI